MCRISIVGDGSWYGDEYYITSCNIFFIARTAVSIKVLIVCKNAVGTPEESCQSLSNISIPNHSDSHGVSPFGVVRDHREYHVTLAKCPASGCSRGTSQTSPASFTGKIGL